MHILSYRGPDQPGGVSGALSVVAKSSKDNSLQWSFMVGSNLCTNEFPPQDQPKCDYVCTFPREIIDGHYRHCNNFLWPILHDMPENAFYDDADHQKYLRFNLAVAENLARTASQRKAAPIHYFIQDYQMSKVSEYLNVKPSTTSSIFWHVPWPRDVQEEHIATMKDVAMGLLHASTIGFHLTEYASNFLEFVQEHMPEFDVDLQEMSASKSLPKSEGIALIRQRKTQLVVQPIGIDLSFWKEKVPNQHSAESVDTVLKSAKIEVTTNEEPIHNKEISRLHEKLGINRSLPFVLSVDRGDYTKGVLPRLEAIGHYFESHPDQLKKIVFVQVCQPTRVGLHFFDRYWSECIQKAEEINSKWRNENWSPIHWISTSLSANALAVLYRDAAGMIVSSVRDGLNLTSKEFIACANSTAVLMLSRGAGSFHELTEFVIEINPDDPAKLAEQMHAALNQTESIRALKIEELKATLSINSLDQWWETFASDVAPPMRPVSNIQGKKYNRGPKKVATAL